MIDVSIVILTYQRRDHLERSLSSALRLDPKPKELMVVDNANDSGLEAWLRERAPQARYIAMTYNAGSVGRNVGVEAATAPIVVTIDDDCELLGTDALARIESIFNADPLLACLNFKVLTSDGQLMLRDWCHPRPAEHASREFETYLITEGACAYRRDQFVKAGGYCKEFWLGHEGVDLAYRLINRGALVKYSGNVSVRHHMAAQARPGARIYYTFTRNGIWVGYRNFGAMRGATVAFGNSLKMAFFSVRANQFGAFWKGLTEALRKLPQLERQPLTAASLRRVKEIRSGRASLSHRIARHLRERLI